ncbi:hypothetical protein AOLI_G00160640 [Acnodon oligacanthus]
MVFTAGGLDLMDVAAVDVAAALPAAADVTEVSDLLQTSPWPQHHQSQFLVPGQLLHLHPHPRLPQFLLRHPGPFFNSFPVLLQVRPPSFLLLQRFPSSLFNYHSSCLFSSLLSLPASSVAYMNFLIAFPLPSLSSLQSIVLFVPSDFLLIPSELEQLTPLLTKGSPTNYSENGLRKLTTTTHKTQIQDLHQAHQGLASN